MAGGEIVGSPALDGLVGVGVVPPQRAVNQVADLVVAGLYVPAGPGSEPVAGDFYDVLELNDDLIALVVGDVAGHGLGAVDRMRQLRAAARAYALEQRGPPSVLERLDRFVERTAEEAFATLWYGEYRPRSGTLTYGSAGHLPPALHVDGGVRLLAEADAPPLGTGMGHALATERTEALPPGAVLVGYSDGLVERRRADIDAQLSLLVSTVQQACDPARSAEPANIAQETLDALVPDRDRAEDDICILVVRRQP